MFIKWLKSKFCKCNKECRCCADHHECKEVDDCVCECHQKQTEGCQGTTEVKDETTNTEQ